MAKASEKRLLLMGNGVNLVARNYEGLSYKTLLSNVARAKRIEVCPADDIDSLHEKLAAYAESHPHDDPYAAIYPELLNLRPTHAHHLLAKFSDYFSRILTFNFDYAMEYALGLKASVDKCSPLLRVPCLSRKKVCHIHGSVDCKQPEASNCIISPSSYSTALKLFPENLPETFSAEIGCMTPLPWFYAFLTHEVHICGAALHNNEHLLWRVLNLRREWINRQIGKESWNNRMIAYLFCKQNEKQEVSILSDKLRDLSVEPVVIPVRNGMKSRADFNSAWECLIGKLVMHLMHVHVYYDELQNLPLGKTANIRSRNKNVSIAQEQDLKYPDLCVVFVPYSKLESERINGKFWLFYCGIEKEVYFWRIPVEKLRSIAKRQFQDENKKRFVLYLNYKTGELFHLLSLQCCATCMKTQSKVFDRLIIDTSADRHLAAKK